jgi:hypothetical protein
MSAADPTAADRMRRYRQRKRDNDRNEPKNRNAKKNGRYGRRTQQLDMIKNILQELLDRNVTVVDRLRELEKEIQDLKQTVTRNGDISSVTPTTKKRAPKLDLPVPAWQPNARHFEIAHQLGHDDAWVADQAEAYFDWLANTTKKHTDFNAGFRNWLKRDPQEGTTNAKHRRLSPGDKLWLGAAQAVESYEARRRASNSLALPLLDC